MLEIHLLRQFQDAIIDILAATAAPPYPDSLSSTTATVSKAATPATASPSTLLQAGSGNHTARRSHQKSKPQSPFAITAAADSILQTAASQSLQQPLESVGRITAAPVSSTALAASGGVPTTTLSREEANGDWASSGSLVVPGHRGHQMNKCLKAWQDATPEMLQQMLVHSDLRLSRFYMWTQTEDRVLLAMYLPTGRNIPPLGILEI